MKNKIFLICITLVLLASLVFAGCAKPSPAPVEKQIYMHISSPSPRTDNAWGQSEYEAYLQLQEKYPEVKFGFSDLVGFAEAVSHVESVAKTGATISYSSGGMEAPAEVSARYPDTWFVTASAPWEMLEPLTDNILSIVWGDEQAGYLSGVLAATESKTGKLGYVAGLDYPDIVKLGAGFLLGARSVNPDVTLSVVYTGSWTDVQKGYDSARTMIDTGVDVIIHYADDCGLGVINASKERGTWVIGEILDQNHLGPETVIASYRFNHFAMLDKVLQDYMAGTLKKQAMTFGLEDGYDMLWPLGDLVSDEAKAKVAEAEAKIRSGEITVPIIAATENFDALIAEK